MKGESIMATLLSQYQEQQKTLFENLNSGELPQDKLLILQELNYRICVLQTMQAYCKSAPISMDVRQIGYHYQLVVSSLRSLLSERKFGPKADEKGMKQRQTAAKSLEDVFADQSRRFKSFTPSSPELYRKSVQAMINTVLPVWVTYRGTYINIEEAFA